MATDPARAQLRDGDPVWFRQTCRGGYGFQRDVPALFVAIRGSRASIIVQLRDGSEKRISVKQENVRPRESVAK